MKYKVGDKVKLCNNFHHKRIDKRVKLLNGGYGIICGTYPSPDFFDIYLFGIEEISWGVYSGGDKFTKVGN